jgi:hypothetical protein
MRVSVVCNCGFCELFEWLKIVTIDFFTANVEANFFILLSYLWLKNKENFIKIFKIKRLQLIILIKSK